MRLTRLGRVLGAAAFCCAVAGVARADGSELDLADGLVEWKWYDLAELIYKRAIEKGKTPAEKSRGDLGLIKLRRKQAETEQDPEAQKKLFDEAIGQLKTLVEKAGGSVDAKFQLADLLTAKGQKLVEQIEYADTAEQAENLRREAMAVYTQVADLFAAVVTEYRPKFEDAKDLDTGEIDEKKFPPQREAELVKAWLLHGESYYHRGRIASEKKDRDTNLKKAIEILQEFASEFEDRIVGYWGFLTTGQAYTELKKFGEATALFSSILSLPLEAQFEQVRIVAYWRFAESLNADNKFPEAVALIEKMEKDYPAQALNGPAGQSAILEKGKALAGQQQFRTAIGQAMRIVSHDRPFMRPQALKLLAAWSPMDPSAGAEIAMKQAEGLRNQYRQFGKEGLLLLAIAAYQEAGTRIQTDEERKQYGAEVWVQVGDAYYELERFYEAGLAYERGAKAPGADPDTAGKCAYWAYRAYSDRFKQTKPDEFDKTLYRNARSYFTSTFPNHPLKGNIPFWEARDLEDDKKFLDAATAYERLDPSSEKFEEALARAGGCYYREYSEREAKAKAQKQEPNASDKKLLDDAHGKLEAFLKRTGEGTAPLDDPAKQQNRQNARALSVFYLGRIAEARGDLKKVLEIFQGFAETNKAQKQLVSDVLFIELRTLDALKMVEEAPGKLAELEAFNPTYGFLGAAKQLVGKLFDAEAEKLTTAGKLEEAAGYSRRAADLLATWLRGDAKAGRVADNLSSVGLKCRKVADAERTAGRKEEALKFFEYAASMFERLYTDAAKFKLEKAGAEAVAFSLSDCQVAAAELLDETGRKEEATKAWQGAVGLLEALHAKNPRNKTVMERLANAFQRANQLEKALDLFTKLATKGKQFSPEWWEAKYWQIEIQFRMGKKDVVKSLLENLRLLTPDLGGEEMAKRMTELAKRAGLSW